MISGECSFLLSTCFLRLNLGPQPLDHPAELHDLTLDMQVIPMHAGCGL